MAYDLPTWVNGGPPARNAENLNKYTDAIDDLDTRVGVGVEILPNLANTSDTAKGDALIGGKRTDADTVAFTEHAFHENRIINAKTDFGFSPAATASYNQGALAYALIASDDLGGGYVYIPPGVYNCNGGLTQGIYTEIIGAGMPATTIVHPTNDAWMTALTPRGMTTGSSGWRGFYLYGNTGASAKGIVFGNRIGTRLENLMVRDYTVGSGLELQNSGSTTAGYTEGTLLKRVHVRGCAKNIDFEKDATGHASFSDTTFISCVSVAQAAGAIALNIGANADVYASYFGIKLHLENNTAIAMNVEAGGMIRNSSFNVVMEGGSGNTRTGLKTGAGSVVTGHGLIDIYSGVVHSIDAASTVTLGRTEFTMPAIGAFHAYASTDQAITASTFTKVNFANEERDASGWFASSRYTPLRAGYYAFSAGLQLQNSEVGKHFYGILYKNGTRYKDLFVQHMGATNLIVGGSGSASGVYANGTTDYFEVFTWHDTTTTPNLKGSATPTGSRVWFSGYYLGS